MKMPPPIATKFTKLVLTILAITILGIILSFVSQDHTLLMLSAGVAVAGGVKIIDYYRTIKGEHYECIEGTLVREQAGYARKRHMIVLALEDGSLEQRILEGRYKLKVFWRGAEADDMLTVFFIRLILQLELFKM